MRGAETDVIAAVVSKLATLLDATPDVPARWPEGGTANQPARLTFTDSWIDSDGAAHTNAPRTIEVYVGRRHLEGNGAPPRIVIYPDLDPIDGDVSAARSATSVPRTIAMRHPHLAVQCWGADMGEAGALYQALHAAFFFAAATYTFTVEPRDGRWETDQGVTTLGEALYHAFAVSVPVVTPPEPTTRQGPPDLTEVIE